LFGLFSSRLWESALFLGVREKKLGPLKIGQTTKPFLKVQQCFCTLWVEVNRRRSQDDLFLFCWKFVDFKINSEQATACGRKERG
jgi:hypothetical protein